MPLNVFTSGSTAGIGLGIARAFKAEGYQVAVNGRDPERVNSVAAELGALPVLADVSTPHGCQAVAEVLAYKWKKLDVLVCNVGSGRSVPPGEETPDEWERMLRLNLFSATNLIHACEGLFPEEGGSIVCISSICGLETLGAPLAYSAAKASLHFLRRRRGETAGPKKHPHQRSGSWKYLFRGRHMGQKAFRES